MTVKGTEREELLQQYLNTLCWDDDDQITRTITEGNLRAFWNWANEQHDKELQAETINWRRLLWLRHGCVGPALYGDDGELQCLSCLLDFKRMSASEIENWWREKALILLSHEARITEYQDKLQQVCEDCAFEKPTYTDPVSSYIFHETDDPRIKGVRCRLDLLRRDGLLHE